MWFDSHILRNQNQNFFSPKIIKKNFTFDTFASKWKLLIVFEVFVLVIVNTLTIRSGRGESRAIWRTQWRPVSWVNFKFIGGLTDDGRIDSREIIGNDCSFSNDFNDEEFFIAFKGILFVFEVDYWNELKENSLFVKKKKIWSFLYLLVKEIFCPVDWSTRRSCKSSKSPPFFVVVLSFVLVIDDAVL